MAESEVISIKGLKDFKTIAELKAHAEAQQKSLVILTEELEKARQQIATLQNFITNPNIARLDSKSVGEVLCETEIEKLYAKAQLQPLDLEDTKKLDLFMKNLYLARNNTPKEDPKEVLSVTSDVDLLALAGGSYDGSSNN